MDDQRIRVFIVEDRPRSLSAETAWLFESDRLEVVGVACSYAASMQLLDEVKPGVILFELARAAEGVELIRELKLRRPAAEVLILSAFSDEPILISAIQAGAVGFLVKRESAAKLVEAIREVSAGGSVIDPKLARGLLRHFQINDQSEHSPPAFAARGANPASQPVPFSEREIEIFRQMAMGRSARATAALLLIAPTTVHGHVLHIYEKLGVHNRIAAINEGLRIGLLRLGETANTPRRQRAATES